MEDSAEKPDPAKIYNDNDMNSFAPMAVDTAYNQAHLPRNFLAGWRELRIPVELPDKIAEGKIYAVRIASVICETVEFYLDGQLIHKASPAFKTSVTAPLNVGDRKKFELRCLIKATDQYAFSGVGVSIALAEIDKPE